MGLNANAIRHILIAKSLGVNFAETVMIGRQRLFLTPEELRTLLADHGDTVTVAEAQELVHSKHEYAEPLLERLGAREVRSVDTSDWERATDIHDMNAPIPEALIGRFTTVLESGTLEHIFDFPRSVRNCMDMLAQGGHFIGISPCNNFLGHGFYQFSPDLFFRIFSPENGFEMVKMFLFEDSPTSDWYDVVDPKGVEQWWTDERHVESSTPAYLAVVARRTGPTASSFPAPQQSKYEALWTHLRQQEQDSITLAGGGESRTPAQAARIGPGSRILKLGLGLARAIFRRFGYEIFRYGYHRKLYRRL